MEDDIKQFIKKLSFTNGKYKESDVFKDLISLETYFINATLLNDKKYANDFDILMAKYTDDEKIYMWNLVIELPILYGKQTSQVDIMGEIFKQLNMSNVKTSQYFTPSHIAEMIAGIQGVDEDLIKNEGYETMCEPSCGSSVMVLKKAKELQEQGYEPSRNLLVTACDIDRYCCYMSYINLSYYDIPAEIICGNTLTNEISFTLYTPSYFEFKHLEKDGKLKVPLCSRCKKEIQSTVFLSEIQPKQKLCIDCYKVEKMLLIMKKMSSLK